MMAALNHLIFTGLFVLCFSSVIGQDHNTKAHFPVSKSNKFPRIRFTGTLPSLHEFTFCSWIRVYEMVDKSRFIFSYATTASDNEIAIFLLTKGKNVTTRVYIGMPLEDFNCPMLDSRQTLWNHLCVTWFAPSGKIEVFVNNDKCKPETGSPVSRGAVVRSGGVAIIGQDQDAVDSKFDSNQAWYGDISDVHLWNEVLSQKQIEEAGKCKGDRKEGNVISWLKTPMAVFDGVVFAETQLCEL